MYSQKLEEKYILDYFGGHKGKFIDIGAFDVFMFSNVRALYERGWSGILVEPQPSNFNKIYEHYKGDTKITVLNCAIGDKNGEVDFYESNGDAVGTTNVSHMKIWEDSGVHYTPIKVTQINVVDFMNEHCVGVDFLNIDTEATNMNVFRLIPDFVWQQIKMLCIEHDQCQPEIEDHLKKFGFSTLYTNAENVLSAKI